MLRRLGRIALAIIAGLVAAWAGWLYGRGPAWTSEPFPPSLAIGFSADGRRLLGAYLVGEVDERAVEAKAIRFDAASGRVLGEVSLAGAWQRHPRISNDFVFLPSHPRAAAPNCLTWYDDSSGHVTQMPSVGEHPTAISFDRRWLVAFAKDGGYVLVSIRDRAIVRRFADSPDSRIVALAFRPDGKRLAVLRVRPSDKSEWIELVEVPTGQFLRRFNLPNMTIASLSLNWPLADRILFREVEKNAWLAFNPDADIAESVRPEPLPAVPLDDMTIAVTSRYRAYVDIPILEPWENQVNHLVGRLGVTPFVRDEDSYTATIIEWPRGKQLAQWLVRGNAFAVSPDGHRLASRSIDGRIRVWDANGLSPTTRSAICGVAAFAITFLLTRHRRRVTAPP